MFPMNTRITSAAIRHDETGAVFTGPYHASNSERSYFVDREEALIIGRQANQLKSPHAFSTACVEDFSSALEADYQQL